MNKTLIIILFFISLSGCKTKDGVTYGVQEPVIAHINLVDIREDKVQVIIDPAGFSKDKTTFYLPRIIPGHYAVNDYGKFIEDFKALDYEGKELEYTKVGESSWTIPEAKKLDKVSYLVNDTYDIDGEGGVFSPSGTNIEQGQNFMLNLHGFVGYFQGLKEERYRLEIQRPETIIPGTALEVNSSRKNEAVVNDVFEVNRYFQVTDNPIMYAKPDTSAFEVEGMKVLLHVHSPNNLISADQIMPDLEKMIRAQKNFLGEIDNTSKYAILLYLSDKTKPDARGTGALEHHTSTVVNLPESLALKKMKEVMTDVVSHEFFHILTPLNVHSKEIHNFDYAEPQMSKHLWMYEGVTEYFANLFQVDQGLIGKQDFYNRLMAKIDVSRRFDDTVPFTVMSENILREEFKNSFYNVYQKGALIGMALDIRLRELSHGESGLLDLMKRLSGKYGKDNPFEDDKLIEEIIDMTYPEIQDFFDNYVTGRIPIPYDQFFDKVGLKKQQIIKETGYFINGNVPYIDVEKESKALFFVKNTSFNSFLKELGVKGGDIIKSINGKEYTLSNVNELFSDSETWNEGDRISIAVERNGNEVLLSKNAFQPKQEILELTEIDLSQESETLQLREAWLKD